MTIDLTTLSTSTQTWARDTNVADVSVTVNGSASTLTGLAAAAYRFGEALLTVRFDYGADGLQLTDGRFEFPPASGQRVSLSEVADALEYKYGVDPLIEFAPGLGTRGYSVADINAILTRLNQEFAGKFSLALVDSTTVKTATQATASSPASFTVAANATDTTNERVTFTSDPGWTTGRPVQVSATSGGLSANTTYYVRSHGGGQYSFFTSEAAAADLTSTTGRVDLTANVNATVSFSAPALAVAATKFQSTDQSADSVSFADDPLWATGTPVMVNATGGGLTASTPYYVRSLGGGQYSFFTNLADASGTGATGRVDLTADIAATVSFTSPSSVSVADTAVGDTSVYFQHDPNWPTGTPVWSNLYGGGLAGFGDDTYYVRNLGGGEYAFFTNQLAASGTGTTDRVTLSGPLGVGQAIYLGEPPGVSGNITGTSPNALFSFSSTDPLYASGARVYIQSGGGGLTGGNSYYLKRTGSNQYEFYTDAALTNKVPLTAATGINLWLSPLAPSASATDTTNEFVTFANDPGWASGTWVRVNVSGGGLVANTNYFVRSLGGGQYSFFTSEAAATGTSTTGRVDLMGSIASTTSFLVHAKAAPDSVSFASDPIWPTGTPVQVGTTAGGLTAGTTYYVRNLGGGRYAFFTSEAATVGTGFTGSVNLTANIGTVSYHPSAPAASTATVVDDWVRFASDPTWATGTSVRASATGGGLSAGVDYFVRSLGGGKYAFFSSAAAAAGTGTDGRVNLTSNISATISLSPPDVTSATVDDDWVAFTSNPGWATGTPVQVATTAGGLTAGTAYYVRHLGSGRYAFFTSAAAAAGTGTAGRVDLTGPIGNVSPSYGSAALAAVLDTASTSILVPATESELRQMLTEGGDLYTDRAGGFYLNGVRTTARDVAVVSRLLAHDNIASEYKVMMDEYAERNNLISAARTLINGGLSGLSASTASVQSQYGMDDSISELSAGQYTLDSFFWQTDTTANTVTFDSATDPAWQTGMHVRLEESGAGLTAGVDYYVRRLGNGTYSFFTSRADALDLTKTITADLTARVPKSARFMAPDADAVTVDTVNRTLSFAEDPLWVDGTAVQARSTLGGLAAGTTYYTKSAGAGKYMFYTTSDLSGTAQSLTAVTADLFRPSDDALKAIGTATTSEFDKLTALLNTLISNKVRDGELDQAKLQTLTAQIQNNTEAMTAMIKLFNDLNAQLAQALR